MIIAPSLIAESLSLKLTSLDQNLDINFNNETGDKTPDLVIWNVLNFQSEHLIRLELLKLREKYDESKFLINSSLVPSNVPSVFMSVTIKLAILNEENSFTKSVAKILDCLSQPLVLTFPSFASIPIIILPGNLFD